MLEKRPGEFWRKGVNVIIFHVDRNGILKNEEKMGLLMEMSSHVVLGTKSRSSTRAVSTRSC
jgi:hypothetical protein